MNIHFATEEEIANWNTRIIANPDGGNVLQSQQMAEQKKLGDWTPRFIVAGDIAFFALEKSIPLLGKIWYIIKGPGVVTVEQLATLLPEIKQLAASEGVFTVKTETEIIKNDAATTELAHLGLMKARSIQPNSSTVFLDISNDTDDIIMQLNQKTRHAIRRAERDGATVKQVPATDENCEEMFRLYKITAEGKFGIRSYEYHKHFWQSFEAAGIGQLFFAYSAEGKLVAAAYALVLGRKSTYKDGASLPDRPVYGMSHFLQWNVIQWAKTKGATIHDFCGAPPSDQIDNPNHPFYGFGRFKTSFNKEVIDFVGVYDIIVKPLPYRIWSSVGERLAFRLHRKRFNENFY